MTEPFQRLRRFLRELKRCDVYRVTVACLAVAFVGIQAARLARGGGRAVPIPI